MDAGVSGFQPYTCLRGGVAARTNPPQMTPTRPPDLADDVRARTHHEAAGTPPRGETPARKAATIADLIDQQKLDLSLGRKLAEALVSTGPLNHGGWTHSGVCGPGGHYTLNEGTPAAPGYPDAATIPVVVIKE